MEQIEKEIEKWVKPYATIVGEKKEVDINLRKENPIKYFLRLTQPNNFESYAIALHSYWINHKISKEETRKIRFEVKDLPEKNFTRINWSDFFQMKRVPFNLNDAILNSVDWEWPFNQMNNERFPNEGSMDEEHLKSFVKISTHFYGNQDIELFYIFMSTTDWKKDLMFSGKINDLQNLVKNENLINTPSLIYPKEQNWVINTDFDLAFSTIGGESKFINELEKQNRNEVFKVE